MNDNKNIATEIQEELENLSPTLAKLSKEHPYSVPEGYFSEASDHASKMAMEMPVQKEPIVRGIISVRNIAVAASILLLALLGWMLDIFPSEQEQFTANEVSVDEMIIYLEDESSYSLDEYELMEELIEIEAVEVTEETVNEDEITSDDIIDYLLDDNIDLSTIMDEL